jgi:hypothetical protein
MNETQRFAIAITHAGGRKDLVKMPWLETDYCIDESDWIVLSDDGWRAVADGDPTIWNAFERKLFAGFYVSQPQLIVVIGHPMGDRTDEETRRQAEVRRIAGRIRSLLLPAGVMGMWTDEHGDLQDVLEPVEAVEREAGPSDEDHRHRWQTRATRFELAISRAPCDAESSF